MKDTRPALRAADARPEMGPADWAMLLGLSVLWGGSFFFNGVAVGQLPTLSIVTLRVGLAAAALWAVAGALGLRLPTDPAIWAAFLAMGLLNNVVPFGLIVWSQHAIASGLAAILNATTPLFTVIIATLLLPDERAGPLRLTGVAIGFLGVVVMVGPAALEGVSGNLWPQIACLGGALSYAFAGVFGRRFKRMHINPVVVAAGQVTASTAFLLPVTLIVDMPWRLAAPSLTTWAAIAGLALLSTALAYVLYFRILSRAGATNLLLVTFLIPVSAIGLGVLVLGETVTAGQMQGMALIGIGLVAIDGRLLRHRPRRAKR